MNQVTSLMVCTYNRLDLTKQMIKSVFDNTNMPFRLIIIDNGSSDGTQEWLQSINSKLNINCLDVIIHQNSQNKGIAIGRNQGLLIANKYNDSFLCTLDNDVVLPPKWLEESVNFVNSNPKFCIGINYENEKYQIQNINGFNVEVKPMGNLGTATMLFHRELHNKIGYFITEYGLYSCEDSDWGWRARLAGYKMAYLNIQGKHLGEGLNDIGEYRDFKTQAHLKVSPIFIASCREYSLGQRSIYINYSEKI